MKEAYHTDCRPGKGDPIVLILGCVSLFVAAVGMVLTGLGPVVLSSIVAAGVIMGGCRVVRRVTYKRYEQQRQQETHAHRKASAAQSQLLLTKQDSDDAMRVVSSSSS